MTGAGSYLYFFLFPFKGVNAKFLYEIVSKPPEFQINPITGVINVTGSLDYESFTKKYTFTVR